MCGMGEDLDMSSEGRRCEEEKKTIEEEREGRIEVENGREKKKERRRGRRWRRERVEEGGYDEDDE